MVAHTPITPQPSASHRALTTRIALAAILVIAALAVAAWWRSGLLDLPSVPAGVTPEAAGLAGLPAMRELDAYLHANGEPHDPSSQTPPISAAAGQVRSGIDQIAEGKAESGLEIMRQGVRADPDSLVLGNAYRMEVFQLRRAYIAEARSRGELVPQFPAHLDHQPIAFFEELTKEHPSRETRLQFALAWVDEMLLFPALEIKAPASVQSVDILSAIIDGGGETYVPALFARGLNHLHRPARLVWPETNKTPQDAAAQDIARCVAIGRKLGTGSRRLQAVMAMTLGDAYVKAGRYDLARSWWQIAQNLASDVRLHAMIHRRYAWRDEEILDRLEAELDRARAQTEQPMTDLAFMWN